MTERELEKIIDRYSSLLWSVSSKILSGIGNEQDAEECVADVFIELWQAPGKYDENRGSLKSWLCMRCRSKSIDRFRKLASRITEELDASAVSEMLGPEETLIGAEEKYLVRNAIRELDEPSREIMIRRFFMDQRPSEIAIAMDLPLRRVENIIYRTKGELKEAIGGKR